jgi:hypothetical protein
MSASDRVRTSNNDPFRRAELVSPSDATNLPRGVCWGLLCAVAGNVAFVPVDNALNDPVTLPVVAGQIIPCFTIRVMATGTTATMRALY